MLSPAINSKYSPMPEALTRSIASQIPFSDTNLSYCGFIRSKVVYIDDEYVNYLYLSELLADTGVLLQRVCSGEEIATYLFSSNDVALIILSTSCAAEAYKETYSAIKRINTLIPIITISWEGDLKNENKLYDIAGDLSISGYIDRGNLIEALSEFLIHK